MRDTVKFRVCIFLAASLLFAPGVSGQTGQRRPASEPQATKMTLPKWGVKTNLLYDATATINLGVELRTSERTSIDLSGNYNNWSFGKDRKWKHYLVQPEFRWWPRETFDGHFFGLHGHYALYNVSNLPDPPFSARMNTHRFEGWLAGAGVSYGYRWNFDHRWALEATLGVGYAHLKYDEFVCGRCGERLAQDETKNYFGPTKAGVSLIFGGGGRAAKPAAPPVRPAPIYTIPAPDPVLQIGFIVPEVEEVKARAESGSAYLDFEVARWEILPWFRNNAAELQKIRASIQTVERNPDATITGISIVGHASPEGTYPDNAKLSERRAQALKNYVRSTYGLGDRIYWAHGEGEDWMGLDSLVAASQMPEKHRILEIIRGGGDYDLRERRLREISGGAPYRQMFEEFYPQLRRSDYRIEYTVAPFTVEKGREVFRLRPGDLSLNEMFLVARTCEPGSEAFNEVFETAARLFTGSDTANLNAAASALSRKDVVSAAGYLDRVRDRSGAVYWNNMGLLAWLHGDSARALHCFTFGGAQGAINAAELRKQQRQ